MSLQQTIYSNIVDNPIQRRETVTLNRQRGKWVWRVMLLITAFVMLIPVIWGFGHSFYDAFNFTLGLLVILNAVVYFSVIIRSVTYATDSIARERRTKTWDLLMLTGVTRWQVVMGKWSGIMRHMVREYLWLYIVRVGTLVWVSASINFSMDYAYPYRDLRVFDAAVDFPTILVAMAFIALLTVIELMMSSALGLSIAFFKFKSKTSHALGILLRIGLAVLLPAITYLAMANMDGDNRIFEIRYGAYSENEQIFATRASTFFADGGMFSSIVYANEADDYYDMPYTALNLATLAGIAMYLTVTGLSLGIAANRAFVRGIDQSNGRLQKTKPKRRVENQVIEKQVATGSPLLQISHSMSDAFSFKEVETATVEIYHYQRRLGRLILRVIGDTFPQYIQLASVAYVEAPAFWKGATFRTASESEFEQFIEDKGIYVNSLVQDSMRLYVAEARTPVYIVAGTAQKLETLPETL